MPFGQLVIGPPGSGKTTYCLGLSDFFKSIGRPAAVINLDPASDDLPYECDVDIRDLVCLEEVQEQMGLGPNGGIIYCMDYLTNNLDWLQEQLAPAIAANKYLLFDCPGQAELSVVNENFLSLVACITQRWHVSLAAVQLVDSHLCTAPHKFMSALLMCLGSMLHLELPHVNVLSKVDLLEHVAEELPISIDSYASIGELQALLHSSEETAAFSGRFAKLTEGLCEVIEDFGLLSVAPLSIQDRASVARVLELVDRANGFVMSGLQGRNPYAAADDSEGGGNLTNLGSTPLWEGPQPDAAAWVGNVEEAPRS